MKKRVRIDAIFDDTDTASADQLRNGAIALQNRMRKINASITSTIKVEDCNHDTGRECETVYSWQKS